ncbi:MAG: L-threonylcarbamoyladenylate synthase [candidate division KSB1 bacterium]|nr:L-threonylcarbamoyladenylate synthase [candidate division KSB1 bacterium]
MRVSINPQNPQGRYITQAVEVLKSGGVIAYPTDTIYGIGCDIFNKKAIERIYQIKGKEKREPLSFICPDLKDISKYAHVSNAAYKIMNHLLPGPYTFVLRGTRLVPKIMLSKRRTVGIRVPDNQICLLMLKEFGNPIVSTSASLSDDEILNDPEKIEEKMGKQLDLILDAGLLGLTPSSVIDLTTEPPTVLRRGKGDVSMFE